MLGPLCASVLVEFGARTIRKVVDFGKERPWLVELHAGMEVAWGHGDVWYHGYSTNRTRKRWIGGPIMSQPTRPRDPGQEAHYLRQFKRYLIDKSFKLVK
jgi:hypothetical protein